MAAFLFFSSASTSGMLISPSVWGTKPRSYFVAGPQKVHGYLHSRVKLSMCKTRRGAFASLWFSLGTTGRPVPAQPLSKLCLLLLQSWWRDQNSGHAVGSP